ncbi:MAG TPA: hypothetical protein VLT83_00670 [Opitutaceae bacterium]|nr:hypothetical protein [Opitutaceae bacterium]
MKTLNPLLAAAALALLLTAAATLRAGPPPDLSSRTHAFAKTAAPAKTVVCNQAGKGCTSCQNCSVCPAKG